MSSAPVLLCSGSQKVASATLVMTVGTTAAGSTGSAVTSSPAGNTIVAGASINNNGDTITGVTDSQGNTYTVLKVGTGQASAAIWACIGAVALGATDTVTVTFNVATSIAQNAAVLTMAGITAADISVTATGTSTAPLVATGVLAQASEVLVAWEDNATAGGAITWGGSWVSQAGAIATAANQKSGLASQVVSATTSVNATGTIVSALWDVVAVSLKISLPVITTTSTVNGTTGVAYSQALNQTGAVGASTWAVTAGALPAGLALGSSSGVISGTPTGAGTSSFTVTITDSNGNTDPQALTLTIGGVAAKNILQPPAGFALWGGVPGAGNAPPGAYQTLTGRPLSVIGRYQAVDDIWPTAADIALVNGGQTLCVDLATRITTGGNATWASITAGTYDAQILQSANRIASLGVPLFVGLNNEFDASSKITLGGGVANYAPYYRHVHDLMAPVAPNIVWLWVITSSNNTPQTASMFPGTQYVDWLCGDPYDPTASKGSPSAAYSPMVTWFKGQSFYNGQPIGIIETGVNNTVADATKATWISKVPAALSALGIQLWIWFNVNPGAGGLGDTTITPGSLAAAQMVSIGASSVFNPPAVIPPGTSAYLIGQVASKVSSATQVITIDTPTATNDAIVVFASVNATGVSALSCNDTKGNTYTRKIVQGSLIPGATFTAITPTVALTATDTISVVYSVNSAAAKNCAAVGCPGVTAVDVTPAAASGTSATPAVVSGPLAQNTEAVIAWNDNLVGGGQLAWNPAFTVLTSGLEIASNQISSVAAVTVSSVASVTGGGTLAASANWSMMLVSLKVGSAPVVSTGTLPGGTIGVAYSAQLTAVGGIAPYTWALSAGSLPAGIVLNAGTGAISGTPTATGTSAFTVQVTDSASSTGTKALSIVVSPVSVTLTGALTITDTIAASLSTGTVTPPGGGGGGPATLVFPQVFTEMGLTATAPVAPAGTFVLNDPVNGKLNTGRLGNRTVFTDIAGFLINATITRPATRVQGPLLTYQAATISAVYDNTDGRFDPDNLNGPYVAAGVSQITAMVPARIRAVYGGVDYPLFSGFADAWQDADVTYDEGYDEVTLAATDGFKILAGQNLAPLAGPAGGGEQSGARITRVLNAAGWFTDHRKIAAGDSAVQGTVYGDSPLNLLQVTADSEIGELYIDGGGNLVFRNRHAILTEARSAVPQAVFGDLPGAGAQLNSNTDFEVSTSGWTAENGATLTRSAFRVHGGGNAGLITPDGVTASPQIETNPRPAVTAGQSLAFSCWLDVTGGPQTCAVSIRFFDVSSVHLAGLDLTVTATVGDSFVYLPVTGLVPPGAVTASAFIAMTGTPAASVVCYADDASFTAVAELPYASVGRANDDTTLANDVQVTNTGGTLQEAVNAASVAKYLFPRTYARSDTILQTDPEALSYAQWVLNVSKDAEDRFETLTIDPLADPANLYPQVLGREIGDRITIIRRPVSTGAPIMKDSFIRGISHVFDATAVSWRTTWTLQDAGKYGNFLVLDSPVLGKLGTAALAF